MVIKAHFDNGDSITTRFSGTPAEAVNYYVGRDFVFDRGDEPERIAGCRAIEFLEGAPVKRCGNGYSRCKRVYMIGSAYKLRHGLDHSIRQTWSCRPDVTKQYTEDYAYNGF